MGKKRKKSLTGAPDSPVSQPALSEEAAAKIVADAETPIAPAVDAQVAETTSATADVNEKKKENEKEDAAIAPAPIAEAPVEAAPAVAVQAKVEAAADGGASEPPASESAPASEVAPGSEIAASEAGPATARPKRRKKKRPTKPPAAPSREALDQKIDRLEAKLEVKKEEAAKAAREGFGSNPALDDQSVPPVDLEVHDEFFAAGEKDHHVVTKESGAFSAIDARHAQKMTAHAHARRAHLSRYVKWSVGAAAAILFLGIGIKSLRGHPNDEPVRRDVAHASQVANPLPQPQPEQTAVTPPPLTDAVEATSDGGKVVELGDDTKVADTLAAAGDAKAPEPSEVKADMPPEKPKNAWQEKQAAKAALERGSNAVAISAGERSVALDASDGEAWLVLGGAYQAMGNAGQAKRCYKACVAQGTKGPIGDCKDMLSTL